MDITGLFYLHVLYVCLVLCIIVSSLDYTMSYVSIEHISDLLFNINSTYECQLKYKSDFKEVYNRKFVEVYVTIKIYILIDMINS